MLQQTRVETVGPYYARFLARFPTVASLAAASQGEVLALWSGLGYYARARNLHRAAREVARRHGGRLPRDEGSLLDLPGVGRYTAGAIRSIAFGERAPVLDGNVARVLCRIFAAEGNPKAPPVSRRLWALAAQMVADGAPGEVNQAMMELGATVCRPGVPDCHVCPVAIACAARSRGLEERFPETPPAREVPEVRALAAFCEERARVLLVERPLHGLLGGTWELPGAEHRPGEPPAQVLTRALRERLGAQAEVGERAGEILHVFTHRRMKLSIYRCRVRGRTRAGRWVAPARMGEVALSRLTMKALAAVGVQVSSPAARLTRPSRL
jgi:A/G-specific adenine glycosylase